MSRFPGSFIQDSPPLEPAAQNQPEIHLQIPEHDELLDVVDTLRSQGISRYVDLPQLVVCGDQSAGKSSVLEAISGGLRFPTKDTLCTRFAIELVLRRSPQSRIDITIIPSAERTKDEKAKLEKFESPTTSLGEFPIIIDAAAKAMGLGDARKPFSKDTLRVEMSGPAQPHLTLIDLPGLYHAGSEQQSKEDAAAIHELVQTYMRKERSIILAVVSAKNDYNNQIVTEYARVEDRFGDRTLGIITKPDTLDHDSSMEKAYKDLVRKDGGTLKLGWHMLRNRGYDTRDCSTEERDQAEESFFQQESWAMLPKDRVGITSLRIRLSKILLRHISQVLPQLLHDVETGISNCEQGLSRLGRSRETVPLQRSYLLRASQNFSTLIKKSVAGEYLDPFFGSSDTAEGYQRRLRAVVQNIMKDFAEEMRLRGHTVRLVEGTVAQEHSGGHNLPMPVQKDEFLKYVKERMDRNRGPELPGTFNPDIIGDLFFEQSKPWKHIIHQAREKVMQATEATIRLTLDSVTDPTTARGVHLQLIQPRLEALGMALQDKTDEVLRPHLVGHPLTFNHYFIENIQKKRLYENRIVLAQKLATYLTVDPEDVEDPTQNFDGVNARNLLDALVLTTEVDFDRFACLEATNAMEAYYKVALKTVIDAFGMYAIEATLLEKLFSVFEPEVVFDLDDETVSKVASESSESLRQREELESKLSTLQQSLKTLQRLKIPNVPEATMRRSTSQNSLHTSESSSSKTFTIPKTPKKVDETSSKSSPSKDSAIGMSEDEEGTNKKSKRLQDFLAKVASHHSANDSLAVPESDQRRSLPPARRSYGERRKSADHDHESSGGYENRRDTGQNQRDSRRYNQDTRRESGPARNDGFSDRLVAPFDPQR
ncbi:hypothetical protein H2200_007959 [Cladophialophora chaetospira]|uniref:Interferon-induced GTP-binding protein Mx n=1 Tax=Cladophialophora chaetospira TaxID=386627 RepID=A0AA38X6R3_9EURO|nr:hypothetical protein H2200_007959 [Cladophialophora chaetospira]